VGPAPGGVSVTPSLHAGKSGLSVARHHEATQRSRDAGWRLALQRLQRILETAGAAEAENGRQVERECDGALDGRHLRAQTCDDCADALRRIGAFFVGFESDDEERLVR